MGRCGGDLDEIPEQRPTPKPTGSGNVRLAKLSALYVHKIIPKRGGKHNEFSLTNGI